MDVEGRSLNRTAGIDRWNKALKLVEDWAAGQRRPFEVSYTVPGLDDYPKKTEKTTLAHAQQVYDYAQANGFDTLSIWAIQRDNGGCPGSTGSNSCSGIVQST